MSLNNLNRYKQTIVISSFIVALSLSAAEKPKSISKQTIAEYYLSAQEAYYLKKKKNNGLLFVDIRTPAELVFVGKPDNIDINIPFMNIDFNQWDSDKSFFKKIPNESFVSDFNKLLDLKKLTKNTPIILLCRSGKRSAKAVNVLTAKGYSKVYTIVEGFEGDKAKEGNNKGKRVVNGWKKQGLPWSYQVTQNDFKMFQKK
jgi:rhodanese-related sulfurtransferase